MDNIAWENYRTAMQALELIKAEVEVTFGLHVGTDPEPDIMVEAYNIVLAIRAGYNRLCEASK